MHRLHHRAVAAARRNAPPPSPALYNILARDGPDNAGLLPTDLIPPLLGQAPSSLIAPFIPPALPTINPLNPFTHTTTQTTLPPPSNPTTTNGISSNTNSAPPVETNAPSPVLNTTTPLVLSATSSSTTITSPSGYFPSPQVPDVVTQVDPRPPSTSLSTSPSTSAPKSNSTNQTSGATTSVAAGVVVGLVGACAMVVCLIFLVRRKRSKAHDDFDANEFRRSAVLMHDPPGHEDVIARGYNPRPPSMIERKLASSPAVTYGNVYNVPGAPGGSHSQALFAGGQPTNPTGVPYNQTFFAGGGPMNPFGSPPPSPGSYATAGHSQASNRALVTPNAPYIMNPPPGPRRTSRPASGNDPGAANGFTFPRLQGSRPSTAERKQGHDPIPETAPANDYVDLTRSSVSPFQAAQYEAISRKLNDEALHGRGDVEVASIMAPSSIEYIDEAPPVPPKSSLDILARTVEEPPPVPPKSPFENPGSESEAENMRDSIRESYTSHQTLGMDTPELQDFPAPPSPALTITSRYRVDSWSSTLPELNLDSSLQGIQPPNMAKMKSFAPKSSPLANNYAALGDEAEITGLPNTVAAAPSTTAAALKIRPDTVYDPDDAYGGI